MKSTPDIPPHVLELGARLTHLKPMRRGSVSTRFVKCCKAQCACNTDPEARHGPYCSLTRSRGGITQSRFLNDAQAAVAQRQVADGRAFRKTVEELLDACEEWADQELADIGKDPSTKGQKGGSKRRSRRRRAGKSNG